MPKKRVTPKETGLQKLKKEEKEFLALFPDVLEMDTIAGASFKEPHSVGSFLSNASFDLQGASVLLGSYTSENPAPSEVTKAVAQLSAKIASDLEELKKLTLGISKEQKPCCRMSAILEDPMTRSRCREEIQHLLSRVLAC